MKTKNEVTLINQREPAKYIAALKNNNESINQMNRMIGSTSTTHLDVSSDAAEALKSVEPCCMPAGRQFLVKNIHDTDLQIITTRWALSYLKGPLNKNDICKSYEAF